MGGPDHLVYALWHWPSGLGPCAAQFHEESWGVDGIFHVWGPYRHCAFPCQSGSVHAAPTGIFVACVFALTLLGIVVIFKVLPVWKIVGDRDLAIGIAMCQMIGYPGTQLISDEIAKTVGETDEEVDYLSTRIGTAYVISGFTSVTIFPSSLPVSWLTSYNGERKEKR